MICNLDLARRLEGAEAQSVRRFCEAAMSLDPRLKARVLPLGGGFACFYGPSDPLNAVKGAGLSGPVDAAELDRVEEWFREHRSPVVIDLCPLADDAFVALLAQRGYTIAAFETVTFRWIDPGDAFRVPEIPGMSIEQVGKDRAAEWSELVGRGFANGGEPMKFAVDFGRVHAMEKEPGLLIASIHGKPAAGAKLSIHEGVVHLIGASVLPEYRGRGIQSALIAYRMRLAHQRGCDLAKIDVRAGSVSQRNASMAGFDVAYTRPQIMRVWPA